MKSFVERQEIPPINKNMLKSNYDVQILVNGKQLREYYKDYAHFVEGRKDSEFKIKIKNNSCERIVAIPSVDGLSVMDGEPASDDSQGYIVNAYSSVTIEGWRTSDKAVAKFFFSDKQESYSVKSDKGSGNLGVIGVVVFPEKTQPSTYVFHHTTTLGHNTTFNHTANADYNCSISALNSNAYSSNYQPSSSSIKCSASLGTGFGDTKKSEVIKVDFERNINGRQEFNIYYNSQDSLKAMGISLDVKPNYVTPNPFPGNYCKPPRK